MDPNYPSQQPPYIAAEVVEAPRPGHPRRRPSILGGFLLLLLILALGGSLLMNVVLVGGSSVFESGTRVEERHFSHNTRAKDKVAIVAIEGTILEGRGFVKRQIDRARKDENVKAVVLRVNSPGGTMSGSDYIYHYLTAVAAERKIPIVVSMGGLAASGGYYVSMAVGSRSDTIFAEPATWTGSIGVLIPHFNVAQLMKDWGIESDSVLSHRLKGMGSYARTMTDEERKIFQELVDEGFAEFKGVIKQGRAKFKQDPAALDKIATGQVFTAQQALRNGLIDKIGFLEDAVAQAIQFAGLSADEVNVVEYKSEFSVLDLVLGESTTKKAALDLDALVELSVPRAYYLCTWLPPLMSSAK
jgi:protease IV